MAVGKDKNKVPGGCTLWARKTVDSDVFSKKPAVWFKIWFYIINRANHKDNSQFKRGQCHLTYETIMLACSATKAQVDHSMRWFKNCRMCATQKATRGFIITICNYNLYQDLISYRRDSSRDLKATEKRHYKQECKNEEEKKNSPLFQIFNHWNTYKGQSNTKQDKQITWKSHRLGPNGSIATEINKSITQTLREGHTAEEICGAIDNYAKILLSEDYFWSYSWSLVEFLTRGEEKHKNAARKWWKFKPDNFIEEHYLTETAKTKRKNRDRGPTPYQIAKTSEQVGK